MKVFAPVNILLLLTSVSHINCWVACYMIVNDKVIFISTKLLQMSFFLLSLAWMSCLQKSVKQESSKVQSTTSNIKGGGSQTLVVCWQQALPHTTLERDFSNHKSLNIPTCGTSRTCEITFVSKESCNCWDVVYCSHLQPTQNNTLLLGNINILKV